MFDFSNYLLDINETNICIIDAMSLAGSAILSADGIGYWLIALNMTAIISLL